MTLRTIRHTLLLATLFLAVSLTGILFTPPASASRISVLHWWTSPGEAEAARVMEQTVIDAGYEWIDMAVSGGGGGNAMRVLKSQVISGNPPSSALINGLGIHSWASLDLLAPVQPIARRGKWETLVPEFVADTMKYQGRYYGVPINIHRSNWLWINPKAFRTIDAPIPTSWEELFKLAPKLQKASIAPLSLSGESWQLANIFESVLLAEGGPAFYRDALVKHKPDAMNSDTMYRVFQKLRRISQLAESHPIPNQSWNQATEQVIENKTAMILTGDWALGRFNYQQQIQGEDYLCQPAFGTESYFIYNIDSLVMFNSYRAPNRRAQMNVARRLMDREFQQNFSQQKGSIPARLDAVDTLTGCQKRSYDDLMASISNNTLVPSLTHGMATQESLKIKIAKVISRFINDDSILPEQAIQSLTTAVLTP